MEAAVFTTLPTAIRGEHGACLHSVNHRQRPYNIQGKIHYEPMIYFVTAIMSTPIPAVIRGEHGACLHSADHRQRPYNIQGKIHYEPMIYFVTAIMSTPLYPLSYTGNMELVYTVPTIGNDLITFKVRYIMNLCFTLLRLSYLHHCTHCHTWGTWSLSTQCPP